MAMGLPFQKRMIGDKPPLTAREDILDCGIWGRRLCLGRRPNRGCFLDSVFSGLISWCLGLFDLLSLHYRLFRRFPPAAIAIHLN